MCTPSVVAHTIRSQQSDRKDSKDPLTDLLDWVKDFKENLKETEFHVSAPQFSGIRSGISYDRGNEIKGSTAFLLTSQKTEIAMSA